MAPSFRGIVGKIGVQKLDIQISLTNNSATYTSGDIIEGVAKISSQSDLRFDKLDVEFVGTARTYNDCTVTAAAASQRAEALHQFLKLRQPDIHHRYPTNMVFQAGKTYNFPFYFVVPEKLPAHVCDHSTQADTSRECHLDLPPSLGSDDNGLRIPDDMAPRMANVQYELVVQVMELSKPIGKHPMRVIASKRKALRIVPVVREQPLLDAATLSHEYVMRCERLIQTRLSKYKRGRLIVEAAQPQPLSLRHLVPSHTEPTTFVKVALRFDPDNDSDSPPRLRNVVTRLHATTHFTTNVWNTLPNRAARGTDPYQGLYRQRVSLACRNTISGEWKKHCVSSKVSPNTTDRGKPVRDAQTGAASPPSANGAAHTYYTSDLLIPITLPSNKTWVPSFRSCLISRSYVLDLTMNMKTPGSQTSTQLKIPMRISSAELADLDSDLESLGFEEEKALYCVKEDWHSSKDYRDGIPPPYTDFHIAC